VKTPCLVLANVVGLARNGLWQSGFRSTLLRRMGAPRPSYASGPNQRIKKIGDKGKAGGSNHPDGRVRISSECAGPSNRRPGVFLLDAGRPISSGHRIQRVHRADCSSLRQSSAISRAICCISSGKASRQQTIYMRKTSHVDIMSQKPMICCLRTRCFNKEILPSRRRALRSSDSFQDCARARLFRGCN
jgi:hypothetical protein